MSEQIASNSDKKQSANFTKVDYLAKIEKEISYFNESISDTLHNPNFKLKEVEVAGLMNMGFLIDSTNEETIINKRIEEFTEKIRILELKIINLENKLNQIEEIIQLTTHSNGIKGFLKNISSAEDSTKTLKKKYNLNHNNKKLKEYIPKINSKIELDNETLQGYKNILSKLNHRLSEIHKNHGKTYKVSKLGKSTLPEINYLQKVEELREKINKTYSIEFGYDNEELFNDAFKYITSNGLTIDESISNIDKVLLYVNKNFAFTANDRKSEIIFSILDNGIPDLNNLKDEIDNNNQLLKRIHFSSLSEKTLFTYYMNKTSQKYEQKNVKIFMLLKKIANELKGVKDLTIGLKFEIALSIIDNSNDSGNLDSYINGQQFKYINSFKEIFKYIEKFSCNTDYKIQLALKISTEIYKYPNYTEKYLEYFDEIIEKIKYVGLSSNNYKLDYVFGLFKLSRQKPEKLIDYVVQMENIIEEMDILGIGIHSNKYIIGLNIMKLGMQKKYTNKNILKIRDIHKELERIKVPYRIDKLNLSFRILVMSLNDKTKLIGDYFHNIEQNKKSKKTPEVYNDAISTIMTNIKGRVNVSIDQLFPGGVRNKVLSGFLAKSTYDINDYYLDYKLGEDLDIEEENEEIIFEEEIKDSNKEIKSKDMELKEEVKETDETKKSEGMELKDEVSVDEIIQKSEGMELSEEIKK